MRTDIDDCGHGIDVCARDQSLRKEVCSHFRVGQLPEFSPVMTMMAMMVEEDTLLMAFLVQSLQHLTLTLETTADRAILVSQQIPCAV